MKKDTKESDFKLKRFRKIIKKMRINSEEGLRCFYNTYDKLIHLTAWSVCHSEDKVNEVVNEVLVKIWKLRNDLGSIYNPEGWIYILTLNTAKNAVKEHYCLPLEENILSDKDEFSKIDDENSFYSMIKNLSETEQTIIIHRFISDLTFQEIAKELNKPLATVTAIYYRSLEKIKSTLKTNKNS